MPGVSAAPGNLHAPYTIVKVASTASMHSVFDVFKQINSVPTQPSEFQ